MTVSEFAYVNSARVDGMFVLDENDNVLQDITFESKSILSDDLIKFGDKIVSRILQEEGTRNLVLLVRR